MVYHAMKPRDDFGGEAVLRVEVDGKPVNVGSDDTPAKGLVAGYVGTEIEFGLDEDEISDSADISVSLVAFLDPVEPGGV